MDTSNRIRRYFQLARQKAWESTFDKRHGAVLVKGGAVVNVTCNNPNFSSFASRFKKEDARLSRKHVAFHASRHAELMCVLGLSRELTEGSTMYVTRINNTGEYRYSRPCPMCQSVLFFCGVKKVYYTTNEGTIELMKIR